MATKFFYGETPKELADEGIRLESYPVALRQDNTKHAERIARYWRELCIPVMLTPISSDCDPLALEVLAHLFQRW